MLIQPHHPTIGMIRQCDLIGLPRSSYYYKPAGETDYNLALMRIIDEQYLRTPFFGSRQMTDWLRLNGHPVNRKRIQRLMRLMGLEGTVPGPHTSKPHPQNTVYPYLLRGLVLSHANLVWSADITFIPMPVGFMYLVAIIDWYSRYVLAWRLSNTIDTPFCLEALDHALTHGYPCIFNTDQGCQFTSTDFTGRLLSHEILISMDGRGRALDNVFIERLWRSVKYEDIYLRDYSSVPELEQGLTNYFRFYNQERPHSSLDGRTPAQVHASSLPTQV